MATPRRSLIFDLDGTLIDSAPDLAAALNALLAERGLGGERRMTGAELLGLQGRPVRGDGLADRLHARAHDHHDRGAAQRRQARENMADHGPPGNGVQHLRQVGFHARPLAGGKDDGGGFRIGHDLLVLAPVPPDGPIGSTGGSGGNLPQGPRPSKR